MSLPKIERPQFEMTIPSTNKKITYRPFLVKEEKILLIAQESDKEKDIVRALTQIINNCVTDSSFNVSSLTTFDLEYMFLKLRAKSVNNIVNLSYQDNEDGEIYSFEVDLDSIEVIRNESHTNKIAINDSIGILMKYPSVSIADSSPDTDNAIDMMDHLISECIDKVYDEEALYSFSDYTKEEQQEFINNLDVPTYDKIREFFETMPKMYYKIEYTNSHGTQRKIELTSLRDFFSWG